MKPVANVVICHQLELARLIPAAIHTHGSVKAASIWAFYPRELLPEEPGFHAPPFPSEPGCVEN